MLARMLGAARLNVHTFEDVENDSAATKQAMIVVIMVSIAGAIGGLTGGALGLVAGLIPILNKERIERVRGGCKECG